MRITLAPFLAVLILVGGPAAAQLNRAISEPSGEAAGPHLRTEEAPPVRTETLVLNPSKSAYALQDTLRRTNAGPGREQPAFTSPATAPAAAVAQGTARAVPVAQPAPLLPMPDAAAPVNSVAAQPGLPGKPAAAYRTMSQAAAAAVPASTVAEPTPAPKAAEDDETPGLLARVKAFVMGHLGQTALGAVTLAMLLVSFVRSRQRRDHDDADD